MVFQISTALKYDKRKKPMERSGATYVYSGVNESDEKDRGQKMYADTYIF